MPDDGAASRSLRLFGSPSFQRLWLAQVVSSLGDWIGFVAITAIAARIGGRSPEAAISLVLSARLVPGFFLASAAGVVVDRLDRRRLMVACDFGRGLVLAALPFAHTLPALFLASLLLEVLTLLWAPAKEASVPNLVPADALTNANSLSLIAAYGTFPVGSAVFALLAKVSEAASRLPALHLLRVSQESLAIWVDVGTFFVSAALIATLDLPRRVPVDDAGSVSFSRAVAELRAGWRVIGGNPVVRCVMLGIATGLVGGGMVVPLGPVFSLQVLGAGTAGFGVLLTALGVGVAVGIVGLSIVQKRLPRERGFVWSLVGGGTALMLGAAMNSLALATVCVGVLGLCAGGVYILGFSVLQTAVDDEVRGRTFATLYALIRFCLLVAFTVAPIISAILQGFDAGQPGVRLTLWLGGGIILTAAALATRALASQDRVVATS